MTPTQEWQMTFTNQCLIEIIWEELEEEFEKNPDVTYRWRAKTLQESRQWSAWMKLRRNNV